MIHERVRLVPAPSIKVDDLIGVGAPGTAGEWRSVTQAPRKSRKRGKLRLRVWGEHPCGKVLSGGWVELDRRDLVRVFG